MTTLQLYQDEIDKLYEASGLFNTAPQLLVGAKNHESESLEDALVQIISASTWLDGELTGTVDFDSLQPVSLTKQINACLLQYMPDLKLLKTQTVYDNPSIEALESTLQGGVTYSAHDQPHHSLQSLFEEWSSCFLDSGPSSAQSSAIMVRSHSVEEQCVRMWMRQWGFSKYVIQRLFGQYDSRKVFV